MVETQELWVALILYGIAGMIVWSLIWVGARFLPGANIRLFVRLATLAALVVPATGGTDSALFVPVIIVGGFALMDTGILAALEAWRPLLIALGVLAAFCMAKAMVSMGRRRVDRDTDNHKKSEEA